MYIAKKHFRLGSKFYQPGDWVQQEDINEAQWHNLAAAGAIETHVDEVMATLDDGSGLENKDDPGKETPDEALEEPAGELVEDSIESAEEGDAFEDMALPDVAVVEEAVPKKRGKK